MNDKQMRDFVEQFKWIFAKTYAHMCPHEYIVKTKINYAYVNIFESVVDYIRKDGFEAYYNKRVGMYYILDEHYYCTMGEPIQDTTIINRAKLSDYNLIDNSWVYIKQEQL